MAIVNVVTVTGPQAFPAGTVDTTYVITLAQTDATVIGSVESTDGTAVFNDVAPGDYVVTGVKNGVSVSANVTVPVSDVTLQVPVSLTVTLS